MPKIFNFPYIIKHSENFLDQAKNKNVWYPAIAGGNYTYWESPTEMEGSRGVLLPAMERLSQGPG